MEVEYGAPKSKYVFIFREFPPSSLIRFFIQVFLVSQSSAVFLSNCPIMPFSLEFTQSRQTREKCVKIAVKLFLDKIAC